MAQPTTEQINEAIRRDNLRTAWRLRWQFTADEQVRLEELCRREWGANWREAVEAN